MSKEKKKNETQCRRWKNPPIFGLSIVPLVFTILYKAHKKVPENKKQIYCLFLFRYYKNNREKMP